MLKYCAVFSLWAALGSAADFITGQAARAVIGQQTFTSQLFGTSNVLLGSVGGLGVNERFLAKAGGLSNAAAGAALALNGVAGVIR